MAKTVLDVLMEQLQADINNATNHIMRGVPKSYDEYREVCGLIRGLEAAHSRVKEYAQRLEEGDDE